MELKRQEEENQKTYNIDKAIFINNGGGYFNNGGFFTGFSKAFKELAQNKDLTLKDFRLLMLVMSYMGEKEMMLEPNIQRLLTMETYAVEMGLSPKSKSAVCKSFNKLEEMGYFKRDKGDKSLEIKINPAMMYSGKTKDYNMVWNQTALDFGNKPRKMLEDANQEDQDWDSHGEKELKKKMMKQHNIDGGIDDVEIM